MFGIVGAFDRENYGDLVYPHLLSELLYREGQSGLPQAYSILSGLAPMGSQFPVEAISTLFSAGAPAARSLIIGGGDLLRVDHECLASHYQAPRRQRLRGSLLERLQQWPQARDKKRDERILMQRVWQEIASANPALFILDPGRMPTVRSVAYCSCGVPFEFPDRALSTIADVMNQAAFIYVRDGHSKRKLENVGVNRSIRVAPDIVTVLSDVIARQSLEAEGRRLLGESGMVDCDRVILFQVNASAEGREAMLAHELSAFARRTQCQIGLLPLGHCHGDVAILRRICAAAASPDVRVLHPCTISDMMALIALAAGFAGTSLHGSVTALSYGVPHLALPLAADKIDGYFEVVGLPLDFRLQDWGGLSAGLDRLASADRLIFEHSAKRAKRLAHAAFRDMVHALTAEVVD